jgi:hypothetical protein
LTARSLFFSLNDNKVLKEAGIMKLAKTISPDDYILSVLSPRERLEAALNVARDAFKGTSLRPVDVEAAVKKVRKKAYARRQKKSPNRR